MIYHNIQDIKTPTCIPCTLNSTSLLPTELHNEKENKIHDVKTLTCTNKKP